VRLMRFDSVSESRIAVVGAGVVGLAVAYHLVKGGAKVTLIDRDPGGDKASFGNAGTPGSSRRPNTAVVVRQ
jgi:glycine/D-amino acid oxidase-like deaminating enzyme